MGEKCSVNSFSSVHSFFGCQMKAIVPVSKRWSEEGSTQRWARKGFSILLQWTGDKGNEHKKQDAEKKLKIEDDGRAAVSAPVHSRRPESRQKLLPTRRHEKLKIKLGMLNFSWFFISQISTLIILSVFTTCCCSLFHLLIQNIFEDTQGEVGVVSCNTHRRFDAENLMFFLLYPAWIFLISFNASSHLFNYCHVVFTGRHNEAIPQRTPN